jgi:hypothetical protein
VHLPVFDEALDLGTRQRRQETREKLVEADPVVLRFDRELVTIVSQGYAPAPRA